jgi:hypothetical protein
MDRLNFLDSISDIQYPEMLVKFFDQFIALKQLVEDNGKIIVKNSDSTSISFLVKFNTKDIRDRALANINTNIIVIYNRPINIQINIVNDLEINIVLQ